MPAVSNLDDGSYFKRTILVKSCPDIVDNLKSWCRILLTAKFESIFLDLLTTLINLANIIIDNSNHYFKSKIQQTKMIVMCQRFGDLFFLGWSGSILQFRQNMIRVGSKSWLLTRSSNITLSLPSYTGSALKIALNFCNGYLSLLYFCLCRLEMNRFMMNLTFLF